MTTKKKLIIPITIIITAILVGSGAYLQFNKEVIKLNKEVTSLNEEVKFLVGMNESISKATRKTKPETPFVEKVVEYRNQLRPLTFVPPADSVIDHNGDSFKITRFESLNNFGENDESFHISLRSNPDNLRAEEYSKTIMCDSTKDKVNPLETDIITFDSGQTAYYFQHFCAFHYADNYIYVGNAYGESYFVVLSGNYFYEDSSHRDKIKELAQNTGPEGIYEWLAEQQR